MTTLTGYSAYVKELPLWAVSLISVSTLCATVWLLNGLIWLKQWRSGQATENGDSGKGLSILPDAEPDDELRGRYQAVYAENEGRKTEIDTLSARIERLKENHKQDLREQQKEIDGLKQSLVRAGDNYTTLEGHYESKKWLYELAASHAQFPEWFVTIQPTKAWIADSGKHGVLDYIAFTLKIVNHSVFDIAVEKELGGEIMFRGKGLKRLKFVDKPPKQLQNNEDTVLVIYQELDPRERDFIEEGWQEFTQNKDASDLNFHFSKLQITIKGSDKFPEVASKQLVIGDSVQAKFSELREKLWSVNAP